MRANRFVRSAAKEVAAPNAKTLYTLAWLDPSKNA